MGLSCRGIGKLRGALRKLDDKEIERKEKLNKANGKSSKSSKEKTK